MALEWLGHVWRVDDLRQLIAGNESAANVAAASAAIAIAAAAI